ncbi:MAG TPA: Glu/Leu/Phe/Val dehydrogenase [Acidimicrobiales bacterium]|nr:Glu/Leu/Phe/Val dehydrogenase [Acidimicrobiales bacterium]
MKPEADGGVLGSLCSTVDDLGPDVVVLLRHGRTGASAAVVVDNTACGPAIGGTRMATDVTVEEVARLARAMTFKSATARLPHGGAKAGIVADPSMPAREKEAVIRWFAQAIRDLHSFIPGPDIGTDERCMAWIHDEIGRSVGLPATLGGIPLDELGATGYGLAIAAQAAAAAGQIGLRGARVAIQGFGAVGTHTARFLAERGASIVAVSDSRGAIGDSTGLPVDELVAWKRAGGQVAEFAGGAPLDRDCVIGTDCEILVPAARPDVITGANVHEVKATLVLEAANIPVTRDAEATLHGRGVLCLPDWVVNAGGVICASAEYAGEGRAGAFERIAQTIRENTVMVIERSTHEATLPRVVAEELALARVREALSFRRSWSV